MLTVFNIMLNVTIDSR